MNPVNSYLDQYVLTADPVELIRMLYQRALTLVHDARRDLAAGEIAKRSHAITRTYEILEELMMSLRDEVAPDFCKQLRSLYLYMQQRLLDANLRQEDAPLKEVHALLTTLSEAWTPALPAPARAEERAIEQPNEHAYSGVIATARRTAAQAYAA